MDAESIRGDVIATVEKNSKEELRISIDEFHGRKLINFRIFYRSSSGDWLPGKQGMALGVDRYRELAAAMVVVGEKLQEEGML
jgi:hypothetical protein